MTLTIRYKPSDVKSCIVHMCDTICTLDRCTFVMSSSWNAEKPHYIFVIKWEIVRSNILYHPFILQEIVASNFHSDNPPPPPPPHTPPK